MFVGSAERCFHHGQPALPQAGGEESAGISSLVSSPLITIRLTNRHPVFLQSRSAPQLSQDQSGKSRAPSAGIIMSLQLH